MKNIRKSSGESLKSYRHSLELWKTRKPDETNADLEEKIKKPVARQFFRGSSIKARTSAASGTARATGGRSPSTASSTYSGWHPIR